MANETFHIDRVEFRASTEKAILVRIDYRDYWIPISQIVIEESEILPTSKRRDVGLLVITEWFAQQLEL